MQPAMQQFPPISDTLAQMTAQDMGKVVATLFLAHGLIARSQSAGMRDLVAAAVLGAASVAWTALMHVRHAKIAGAN